MEQARGDASPGIFLTRAGTIPSPEYELLLSCCRNHVDEHRAARLAALLRTPLDWAALLRLARHHGILPLLHRQLEAQRWRGVPAEHAAAIKAAYRAHLIRNLEMVRQLYLLLDLLARRSLRTLPVKGPVLAVQVYGDVGLRAFNDLDLLIAPNDFHHCCCLLRDGGFAPEIELEHLAARLFASQETSLDFHHRGKELAVELHWNFLPRCFNMPYGFDALWNARRSVRLEHRAVAALSDSDTMRYLLLHGFKHGWDRLCLVSDTAHAAASPQVDWSAVLGDDPSGTMVRCGLLLTDALVPDVIPREAITMAHGDSRAQRLAALFAGRLWKPTPATPSIFGLGGLYVAGQQGIAMQLAFLWRLLFVATVEDWKRWRFRGAFWRFPVLRPWRLLTDHLLRPGA